MCSEAEARQIIGTEGARVLIDIVEGAWKSYLNEQRPRRSRTRANVVWDYMVDAAEAELLAMDGVRGVILPSETPAFVLRERMLLRFKKLDRNLMSSNVATRTQRRVYHHGIFDGMPELPVVTCGYILDAAEASVERVVVVRCVRNEVWWWIDLRELAGGVLAPVKPIIPDPNDATSLAPLPSIARRDRAKDGSVE